MLSITYVSAATTAMSDDDVSAILVQARENNERDELTGMLLYHRGRFIQTLEGPDDPLRSRFAVISADPRHRIIDTIREQAVAERQFAQWTMGFRPLSDDSARELAAFEDFFDGRTGRARLEHADNEAQQLLEWLAEYWLPPH